MEIQRPETLAAHTEIPNIHHKNGIQLQNSAQHPYFYRIVTLITYRITSQRFAPTLTPCHYITILVLYVLRAACEIRVLLAFRCLLQLGAIISMTITRSTK